jgi:hypothetical protein
MSSTASSTPLLSLVFGHRPFRPVTTRTYREAGHVLWGFVPSWPGLPRLGNLDDHAP